MIYRRHTEADTKADGFRDLVRRGLYSRDLGIPVSEDKLFQVCAATAKSPHYGAIAEHDGKFMAYIGGLCGEHYWCERQQFNIIGWYSTCPGAGMVLLNMALQWAKAMPYIKTVLVTVNPDVAERVGVLLKRKKITSHAVPSFLIEV